MLLFGHAGITLGLAIVAAAIQTNLYSRAPETNIAPGQGAVTPPAVTGEKSWLSTLSHYGDLRFLAVGSLLPDIIDKPVGLWLISSGRMFCHSLLFLILISGAGFYLWRARRRKWLLLLAVGTFCHLLLDQMWILPQSLFWPLSGWNFPVVDRGEWLGGIFYALLHIPSVYIPEIIGVIIVIYFGVIIQKRHKLISFIIRGQY